MANTPVWPEPLNDDDQKVYDDLLQIELENEDPEDGMRAVIGYINDNYIRKEDGKSPANAD